MNLHLSSSVIIAKNFEQMKSFYMDVLHQEIEFDFGKCIGFKSGISIWELRGDMPIAKHLGRTYSEKGNQNLEICFETEEFDELVKSLENQPINYLHKVAEEPWGQKTIRFYDPENNLIEVGETIDCFVKRFHRQGMTPEEVAKRTSVPVEHVNRILLSK